MTLQQVNRYTKAPISGKRILCPNCERISIVYHFSWCAIKCQHCNQFINKEDNDTTLLIHDKIFLMKKDNYNGFNRYKEDNKYFILFQNLGV